jgi:hypothetical protein
VAEHANRVFETQELGIRQVDQMLAASRTPTSERRKSSCTIGSNFSPTRFRKSRTSRSSTRPATRYYRRSSIRSHVIWTSATGTISGRTGTRLRLPEPLMSAMWCAGGFAAYRSSS